MASSRSGVEGRIFFDNITKGGLLRESVKRGQLRFNFPKSTHKADSRKFRLFLVSSLHALPDAGGGIHCYSVDKLSQWRIFAR